MAVFWGSSPKVDTSDEVLIEQARIARQNISDIRKGTPAEQLARIRQREKIERSNSALAGKFRRAKTAVGFEAGRAAGVAMRQEVDFSNEQVMLSQMFGGGSKIWGINNQPVTIHNDLNPSRSDPFDETAGMFGFGSDGERSGLF